MQDFKDKVAVVTGGASGIGRAMAELFLGRGMKVVLGDIEQQALDRTVAELSAAGGACIGQVTDVSQAVDVQRLAETAQRHFGSIDVACNNAGVFTGGLLWEESLADYQWLLGVNTWGVIHGIRTFVPIMRDQGTAAHIVNTASMAAVTALPYSGIYHMTKHAVLALSESLYHELAFHAPNVKVSVLCPEAINTGIAAAERNRPDRYSAQGDIVASGERDLVTRALADSVAAGLGPEVMASRVLDAIEQERFYILSEDAWRQAAHVRLDDIRAGRNPTFAPPVNQ